MTNECKIEYRRRALRHLEHAIAKLELAGCDDIKARVEAARLNLVERTPCSKPRRRLNTRKRAVSGPDLARAAAFEQRLRGAI